MVEWKGTAHIPFRKGLAPALKLESLLQRATAPKNMPFLGSLHPVMEGGRTWTGAISAQHGICALQTSLWMDRCFTDLPHSSNVFLPLCFSPLPSTGVCLKKKDSLHTQIHLIICFQEANLQSASRSGPRKYINNIRDLGAKS